MSAQLSTYTWTCRACGWVWQTKARRESAGLISEAFCPECDAWTDLRAIVTETAASVADMETLMRAAGLSPRAFWPEAAR